MEPDEDVLEMVRRQLDRDPPPSTEALYGRAARINEDIYGLSLRQFNATYVLRVKREQKRAEREGSGPGTGSGASGPSPAESGAGSGATADGGDGEGEELEPRPGGFLDALEDAGSGDDASGAGDDGASAGDGTSGTDVTGGEGTDGHQARRSRDDAGGGRAGREVGEAGEGGADAGLRARIREVFWRYARQVAAGRGLAGAVAAVETVDDRVEEILDLAAAPAGETAAD